MTDSKQLTRQRLDSLPDGNLLIIDGDAIPHMIGWHHREHREISVVHRAVDQWFRDFLLLSAGKSYLGIIGPDGKKCFRYYLYKFKPYKGTRTGKDEEGMEWIQFWEPIIRSYLIEEHGFVKAADHLETDDVVACAGMLLPNMLSQIGSSRFPIICSPDKDLRQIVGYHFDYRKVGEDGSVVKQETISVQQAQYKWCMQMLTGDTTDNIAGIPGIGEKKAEKILEEAGEFSWKSAVRLAYQKYFGAYYGNIIYAETEAVITMMTPVHPLWDEHGFDVEDYLMHINTIKKHESVYFEVE